MSNKRAEQERLRRLRKAQGLVHIKGWVSPSQAEAIQTIMNNNPVHYKPMDDAVITPSGYADSALKSNSNTHSDGRIKLRFEKKPDHPGAWTVWAGRVELGTVYKHIIDENPRPVTVWMAYRPGQRSSRHETRRLAAATLLKEYRGPL